MSSLPGRITARLKRFLGTDHDAFLADARGVIHVGANLGQERHLYAEHGLDVVWIEPIPDVFSTLVANIRDRPRQRAVRALVTDENDREYRFHVASNDGGSSSMLEMHLHRAVWPEVVYEETLVLAGVTLPTLIEREDIELARYDVLTLDTQGSELLVLRGAEPVLRSFRYIRLEVADFEAYQGCCQLGDVEEFMDQHGLRLLSRAPFATMDGVGTYYDVVYTRRSRWANPAGRLRAQIARRLRSAQARTALPSRRDVPQTDRTTER